MKEFFRKKKIWMIVPACFLVVFLALLVLLYTLPLKNKVGAFDYSQCQYEESGDGIELWTDSDIESDYLSGVNLDRYVDFGKEQLSIANNGNYTFAVLNDQTTQTRLFKVVVRKQEGISTPYVNYVMPRQFKYGAEVTQMFRGVKFDVAKDKIIANHKSCKKLVTYPVDDFYKNYTNRKDKIKEISFDCEQLYVVTIPQDWNVNIQVKVIK